MKPIFTSLFVFLFFSSLQAQFFQLTVENGYGSTTAAPGDTLHIWAEEWGASRTFSHWSGDTSFLEMPEEWHTRVIMPAQNVTIQSNTKILPTGANNPLSEEMMMGRDRMKRVFSYFPANAPPIGVCWLWHGTGGSANSWAGSEFEQHQFVKYLVGNGWGVIVTESDESTTQQDLDGNGDLQYDFFPDSSISADIANVRAIRDTFIQRGKMTWETPQAALGFSAGGAFSTLLASILDWRAAVSHCHPGVEIAVQNTTTPLFLSMNQRDNHPGVGPAGNLNGFENWQYLKDKGLCADFKMLRPSPAYPQRFKRMPGITTSLSYSIHNELVANGCFGPGGYLEKAPAEIEGEVLANPSNWPVALSLTATQRQFVLDQLQVLWSAHHFHTDFMAEDFKFIANPCATFSKVGSPASVAALPIFPNPTNHWLHLPENTGPTQVFDLNGKKVLENRMLDNGMLDVSILPSGLYFLKSKNGWGKFVRQ